MIGQTVSHYRVLRRLGGGGMAEVYEAEDLNLGRRVALKFLTHSHTDAKLALRRFEREARAASSLNHPHICTIHDFGEHGGQAFLVMEVLDGETLRATLAGGPLDLARVIGIGIQISDALEFAHGAGVIHRDITPSNIFITARGDAKILDFGLAKVMSRPPASPVVETEGPTVTADDVVTSPGAAMGTVAYMSPEQARGEELDCRTDLFSFGVVLYEMATGRRPFTGRTSALVFDAILHRTPQPPAAANPALPPELGQIIDKALEKERRLRYQSAAEIKVDLERLKRREESARNLVQEPVNPSTVSKPRRAISRWGMAFVGLAAVAAAVTLYLVGREPEIPVFTARRITTASGWQAEPSIAPTGDVIAYVSNERGETPNIFLIRISGAAFPQPLVVGAGLKRHPTWFPDGQRLAFVWERTPGQPAIFTVSRSGGAPEPLLDGGEDPAVSPDGARIAFVRKNPSREGRIFVAPIANVAAEEALTTGLGDGAWDHREPAWSPDGTQICYRAHRGIWIVPATPGNRARLVTDEKARDSNPFWSHDKRYIYFSSKRAGAPALWRVSVSRGRMERLTPGTSPDQQGSLSSDGRILAISTLLFSPDLVVRNLATGEETTVNDERDDICPVFGPDLSVYFVSNRAGKNDIWVQRPPLSGPAVAPPLQLTNQPGSVSHPTVSPDGRWVAYYRADERNTRDIWIVPTSGGTPTGFTTHPADDLHPAWSPDGTRIAFASQRTGGLHIWVGGVSEGRPTGEPVEVTFGPATSRDVAPVWSPDGLRIAYLTQSSSLDDWEVRIANADGHGAPELLTTTKGARRLRWDATGRRLLVSGQFGEQVVSLRAFDPTTMQRLPLSRIEFCDNDDLLDFDVSRDGQWLVFTRDERRRGSIWVYEAQRPF